LTQLVCLFGCGDEGLSTERTALWFLVHDSKQGFVSCYDPWGESFDRGLHFPGMLCRVGWQLVTDVSEQCVGPICKGYAFLDCFTLEDGTDMLSWNW